MKLMGTRAHRPHPREQGFTLTELLVAMVLAGIVMASLYSAYVTQQRAYTTTENVTVAQQNLRSSMYFVEKDLRMAGYDPKDAGGFGFPQAHIVSDAQDNVRFTLDKDEDGVLSGTSEYIAYQFNAAENTLGRDPGTGQFQPIASNISGVTFVFLTAAGNPTSVASTVRSVDVFMLADRGGHTRDLQTRILCRNVGL